MKKFLFKFILFFVYFCFILILAYVLKWPQEFDSHVYLDSDFKGSSYILLIIYRVLIYFTFPFFVSLFEFFKRKNQTTYKKLLIQNFNIQFCTYALISGIYVLFGLDKLFNVEIFGASDAMLFITGFIFTTIIDKSIPSLISDDKKCDYLDIKN